MNLNHLSIFQAVANSGSVSAGAQRLHISQSAVSKQLREFEHTHDVLLFDRLPRGMRLTEAGKLLLGYANRLFAIESEAENALGGLQDRRHGRLSIGASRTIGAYLLPAVLAAYRQRYPGVEMTLHVENTREIESRLVAGEIDIGFAEGIVGSDQLDYRVWAKDDLVLVTAPKDPVTRQAPIALQRVAELPLLMHEIGSGTREVTETAFAQRSIVLRPIMTLASTEAIKQTVATGVGVAILSSFAIRTELAARVLAAVPIKGLVIRRPLYMVRPRNSWASPAMQAFLEVLEERRDPSS